MNSSAKARRAGIGRTVTVDVNSETRLVLAVAHDLRWRDRPVAYGDLSRCALGAFPDVEPRQQFYGWLGAAFFLLGAYAVFSQGFGKDRPTLTLTPEGFHFTSLSARMIPWSKVETVHRWAHGKTPLVIVKVDEDVWSEAGMTEDAVKARIGNKVRGVDGVAIAATGLPIKFADLLATFEAYSNAAHR